MNKGLGPRLVFFQFADLNPEVVGEGLRSIVAVQLDGDDGGQQLALHPRER